MCVKCQPVTTLTPTTTGGMPSKDAKDVPGFVLYPSGTIYNGHVNFHSFFLHLIEYLKILLPPPLPYAGYYDFLK